MKESIGYSVTINIIITFIIIVFAFLASAIVYFKTNKAGNIIVETIQKYEGYNPIAKREIEGKLASLGYSSRPIDCSKVTGGKSSVVAGVKSTCEYKDPDGKNETDNNGYCVYRCIDTKNGKLISNYYYYKIRINMMLNIPLVGQLMDIPIYVNTDRIFNFTGLFEE